MQIMKMQLFRSFILLFILICLPFDLFADGLSVELDKKPDSTAQVIKPKRKPVFIEADLIHGYYEQEIEAVGKAQLSCGEVVISADRMKYFQATNDAEVASNVHIERSKDILEGTNLKLNLETEIGHLDQPRYHIKEGGGRGTGDLLLFEGKDHYRLKNGSYTTCPEGNDDWFIRAKDLQIDNDKQIGTARGVSIRFKDVPILYLPWMDFSFSGKRKSGMLAPIFGNTAKNGAEVAIPFYWNIAPNIDATVSARAMSKRGLMINNELRYLGKSLDGNLLIDVLPNDLVTNQTRYGLAFGHSQYLGNGWRGNLAYNRVSDDLFFRDIANNLAMTSTRNLLQQVETSYQGALGTGGTLSFTAMAQRFQTLQDPLALFISPYKRLPQLTMNAIKRNVAGMDLDLTSSWTNFSHPTLVDGKRLTFFPNVSVPLSNAYGYLTPKVGLHYTRYDLSSSAGSGEKTLDRALPIVSLDSGVVFERDMAVRGNHYVQTLEPRVFYVYIPYSNQNKLPNFDSAESDFSFAQMLIENRFSGNDRINDANQVTMALTSRLIEPDTGIERLRMAVGEQFRFDDRRVTLTSPQITSGRADLIAAISGRITSTISTDTNVQFDQNQLRSEKVRTGMSYQPELGKVVNLGYRFTRDILKQVDASVQWPFTVKLNGVARVNYSLHDDELLAGLAGFEYKSCCWALRLVLQQFTTATQRTSTALFLQLELNGLMGIGTNPLTVLEQNIPGYSRIN
ncbi:MAG: LPS-assembly protein LptD [Nitrosomonas sp.]|nr:LPS-assembly protein LptD [Nitrosomonas sp.]MDP1951591.1 LPS-assembly protein LptD [Nitrosomonas sp.]